MNLVAGDGHRLPFESDSFDLVVAQNAFHHLPEWHRAGLEEIRRVLKPDGTVIFRDPLRYNPFAWTFRKLFETRDKTEAEAPLNPVLLRDRLERVFDDVDLQGNLLFSPVISLIGNVLPFSLVQPVLYVYRIEQRILKQRGLLLAGQVIGVASNPR